MSLWKENPNEYMRQWRAANREKYNEKKRQYMRQWLAANPHKNNAYCRTYRALKRNALVNLTQTEEWMIGRLEFRRRLLTARTGIQHHLDHIVPLTKGGIHHPINLKVMVGSENQSKNNKMTDEALALLPVVEKIKQERGVSNAK